MIKNITIIFFVFLTCITIDNLNAQQITKADYSCLAQMEDSLKLLSYRIIHDTTDNKRLEADNQFVRNLVQALKIPHSFYYPFDSIQTASKLYPEDSSFRIITWQYQRDENYFRQRGAIQMNTSEGSLKLFPLFDYSEFVINPTDSMRTAKTWIGAIYYKIIQKRYDNKNYYTLLGFDDHSSSTTKKWIEVLTFDDAGVPHFGGNFFRYPNDSIKPAQPAFRFCIEYKKTGGVRLNYDPELDIIAFDHLISDSKDITKKETLVSDGTHEGFKWENGRWIHIDDPFNELSGRARVTVPMPIKK